MEGKTMKEGPRTGFSSIAGAVMICMAGAAAAMKTGKSVTSDVVATGLM